MRGNTTFISRDCGERVHKTLFSTQEKDIVILRIPVIFILPLSLYILVINLL